MIKILNKIIYLVLVILVVFVIVGCKKKEEKYELYQVKSLVTNEESPLFDEYEYYYVTLDYKNNTICTEYKFKSKNESETKNGTFVIEENDLTITLGAETIKARKNVEDNTLIINLIVLEFYYKKIN